jgi:methionyl-tRNA formyltransferase
VRVVFFGTPEFAVPSLEALLGEGFDVLAVVTQPDKPQGRSRSQAVAPPVKVAALAEGIPVLQPARPTDGAFVDQLRTLAPDVGVVVAYGHILKPELLALPRHGMVNVHPSLLPELRGAAPVEWAILNGLEKTGVTIMRMDEGLDSGPILHQLPHYIEPEVTGGELSEHLAEMGAQALVETLSLLEQNALKPVPQDHARATHAPKLTRDTARIRWSDPADKVARTIRALDPKPGAWTVLQPGNPKGLPDGRGTRDTGNGKRETLKGSRRVAGNVEVKLFGAKPVEAKGAPGEVLTANGQLLIATGSGAVEVEDVQPAGKPRMSAADWLRGRGVAAGGRFA